MRPSSVKPPDPMLSHMGSTELRDRIVAEQTVAGVLRGSLLGGACATALYIAIWMSGLLPPVLLFVPGIAAGYVAKLTGRVFELKYRAIAGAAAFVGVVAAGLVVDPSPMILAVALPNALLAAFLARRRLSKQEEYAIYRYRMGVEK